MLSRNASVVEFLNKIQDLTTRGGAVQAISEEIRRQAEKLADDIRAAAPVRSGRLRSSVRVEPGRKARNREVPLQYLVRAGGPLTTVEVRKGSGVMFDYSLFVEFGTINESAQPFFYNTARSDEAKINRAIEKRVDREFGSGGSKGQFF